MLDPKEYAKQLAEKYFVEFDDLSLSEAKECALIDVQNTIDALERVLEGFRTPELIMEIRFHKQVKELIQNE